MKFAVYNEILDKIRVGTQSGNRECLKSVAKEYPSVSMKTLGSIHSQDYQRKVKKCHYRHFNPETMEYYYITYLQRISDASSKGPALIKMASEVDLSPALLARAIVERHLFHTGDYGGETPPRSAVSLLMREPFRIQDPTLSREVALCILGDDNYGHIVDAIKTSIGYEYEKLLKQKVAEADLSYLDEDQMRVKGYDKTPDIKLEVPIAVNGHVVNWIESKASFGDDESHGGYLKDQFWSYWNRFGPGLVIYWFGFIDELDVNRDKGILLMDHFPEDIVYTDPTLV